ELMCVLMSSRAINYTGGAIKSITGAYDAKYSPVGFFLGNSLSELLN
ncbi:hypothetical protein EV211_1651, partial [Aminicella lysinilytica]